MIMIAVNTIAPAYLEIEQSRSLPTYRYRVITIH